MTPTRGRSGPRARREVNGVVQRPDGLRYLSPVRAQALLGLIRAGESLDRELDAELVRAHGVSLRAFEVLLFLAVFSPDGQLRMTDLIAHTPLSQSRVSRLVAELEQRGLVRRLLAEQDRRGVLVSITDQGVETFRAAQDTHLAGLEQRLFSRLSEREIAQLAAITSKLLAGDDGDDLPSR
jgi:DNA-binding MarR family transcriptional regulator